MNTVIALLPLIAAAVAFDCFGRNNSCAQSHMTCDTGYEPFCEHRGPEGFCTCDKECTTGSNCTNAGAEGCPDGHGFCDPRLHLCHCGPRQREHVKVHKIHT